jgi:ATP-dependent DNA ligase
MINRTNFWQGVSGHYDPSTLVHLERTGDYVAEPKRDGIWCAAVSSGKQTFYSRNGKSKDVKFPILPINTIGIGELGYGQEQANIRKAQIGHDFMDIFDILMVNGRDVSSLDDNERYKILEETHASWSKELREYFILNPRWTDNFSERFESEDEGLILKQIRNRPEHSYQIGTRNPYWLRFKKELVVEMVIMNYTISDAESYQGMKIAKCITCGAYKNGILEPLVDVGSFPVNLKADVVKNWSKYQGRVVSIKCNKVFKSGSLRHPSLAINPFRDDKSPIECTFNSLFGFQSTL